MPLFLSTPTTANGRYDNRIGKRHIPVQRAAEAVECLATVSSASLHARGQELFETSRSSRSLEVRNTSVSDGLDGAFSNYTKVCALLATDPSYFRNFRRVQEYLAVVEHTGSAKLTYEYIARVTPWLLDYTHLFATSDGIGNPIFDEEERRLGYLQRQTADYVSQLGDMLRHEVLPAFGDVVELGIGYGGLSKVIQDVLPVRSYTLIDLYECLALASRFLSAFPVYKARNIFLESVRDPKDMDHWRTQTLLLYDTCISSYAFSELSRTYREFYWHAILSKCRNGFILDNSDCLSTLEDNQDMKLFQRDDIVRRLRLQGRNVLVIQGNEQGVFIEACPIYKIVWNTTD